MVLDRVEIGILHEQTWHTETTTSSVLDPPLPKRLAQDVPRDPKQPRQCKRLRLMPGPASPQPSACEDFGGQIGRMVTNPRPRPGKHPRSVSVIDHLERIGRDRPEEFRVRRPYEITSHNQYLTFSAENCVTKTCRSLRKCDSLAFWMS